MAVTTQWQLDSYSICCRHYWPPHVTVEMVPLSSDNSNRRHVLWQREQEKTQSLFAWEMCHLLLRYTRVTAADLAMWTDCIVHLFCTLSQ